MVDNKDFKGKSKSKPVKSDIVNVPLNQAAVLAVAEEVVGGPAKKFGKDRQKRPRRQQDVQSEFAEKVVAVNRVAKVVKG